MKKSLRNSILLLLTAMLLTVSALADSGPKAQLTVKVVNCLLYTSDAADELMRV